MACEDCVRHDTSQVYLFGELWHVSKKITYEGLCNVCGNMVPLMGTGYVFRVDLATEDALDSMWKMS